MDTILREEQVRIYEGAIGTVTCFVFDLIILFDFFIGDAFFWVILEFRGFLVGNI